MNAFELLKQDHAKVKDLFAKLESTTERAARTRGSLFEKLKTELETHTHIEESILYPEMRNHEETHEIALEAYEEHALAKHLLEELSSLSLEEETWAPKMSVLRENVEHHIKEEEGVMFKKARSVLSSEEMEEMGERMAEEKKRVPSHA